MLYGHSGAGKTLTLAAIAGLLRPRAGTIEIGGRTVFDNAQRIDLPPQDRRVGYVIQDSALFPHMDVRRNVMLGVEDSAQAAARYDELRDLLSIGELDRRRPRELSGGQQQRVALARALVRPTDVLLLDEPFSALDEALRADLRAELLRLRQQFHVPILFVTHDLREAYLLADRIAVVDEGRLLQFAQRDEVFQHPASMRVAELTGVRNRFQGRIDGDCVVVEGLALSARLPAIVGGAVAGSAAGGSAAAGAGASAVDVVIRAERCNLRRSDPDGDLPPNCFVATVVEDLGFGNTHTLRLEPETRGPSIEVEVASRPYEVLGVASRTRWVVELPEEDLTVMPRGTS